MKIILSSRRHHYLAKVSIFLVTVALIVGMVGCGCDGGESYTLTIGSTAGGAVTDPGEGIFTYSPGTVVGLVAVAEEGYCFVEWTGDVGTIANVEAATTNITVNSDYYITTNFAPEILEIRDWYDLDAIRDSTAGSYLLMNDLDSTTAGYEELASPTANAGKGWQPIIETGFVQYDPFNGIFDGQGYEIRDLFIYRPSENNVGLFSFVHEGVIKGVGVVNATVTGNYSVGGLVGIIGGGTVSNSYSTGSVTGNCSVGGLVGYIYDSTVSNSYSTASVTSDSQVGGLVGYIHDGSGTVSDSHSTGSVTGNYSVGGLVGVNGDTVTNSYSTGNVTGRENVGGLVGWNCWGNVSDSHSTGSVTGWHWVGGLVGRNYGTVNNCYSNGSVTGSNMVGGLVGDNPGTVSNSFWDWQTSGQTTGAGTPETTENMKKFDTFSGAGWNITTVANPSVRNPSYIWNIVDDETYPFLSCES